MRGIAEPRPGTRRTLLAGRRAGWFAALYLAGLLVTLALTYGLRALLP